MSPRLVRFGPLDLMEPVPICLWTPRRELTIYLKSKSLLLEDLPGLRKMALFVRNRCVEPGSILWMLFCMLTPFTVAWDRSCLSLVVYALRPCLQLNQVCLSLFISAIFQCHRMP